MATPASSKPGDKLALQADGSFVVVHAGATLHLKLHADTRSVELLAIDEPDAGAKPAPVKIDWKASDVLDHLSRSNAAYILPFKITDAASFTTALRHFDGISQAMEGGATKPRVLLRADAVASLGTRADVDAIVQDSLGGAKRLSAHIVSYPKQRKK